MDEEENQDERGIAAHIETIDRIENSEREEWDSLYRQALLDIFDDPDAPLPILLFESGDIFHPPNMHEDTVLATLVRAQAAFTMPAWDEDEDFEYE